MQASYLDGSLPEFFDQVGVAEGAEALSLLLRRGIETQNLTKTVKGLTDGLRSLAGHEEEGSEQHVLISQAAAALDARWKAYSEQLAPESRSLGGFIGELSLAGKSVIEGPGARLLTVHAAKGLEFRSVALVGMNEGTIPDFRAKNSKALDDEKRIAYVAITRASRELVLTRPQSRRMPWGDMKPQNESRFIQLMGLTMDRQ